MAHGFLQSFDNNINVYSAGTLPAVEINRKAVLVMKEAGVDISSHKPDSVDKYFADSWDYVITVCDDANESCPVFPGSVSHRLHIGFQDPSKATGTEDYIMSEFRRVRDEIKNRFYELFIKQIKKGYEF
jgi:arsenate reductase